MRDRTPACLEPVPGLQLLDEQAQLPPHPPQPPPVATSPAGLSPDAVRLANVENTARVLVLSHWGQTCNDVRVE